MKLVITMLFVTIFITILGSGCIGVDYSNPPRDIPDNLLTSTPKPVVCETVIVPERVCGAVDVEEDYNEFVCSIRPFRYESSKLVVEHSDEYGNCYSAFTTTLHNLEFSRGLFTVELELIDLDSQHFETILQKNTFDSNQTRDVRQRYRYTCGLPHIVEARKIIIPPEGRFCDLVTKTRINPTYICEDKNVSKEVCK